MPYRSRIFLKISYRRLDVLLDVMLKVPHLPFAFSSAAGKPIGVRPTICRQCDLEGQKERRRGLRTGLHRRSRYRFMIIITSANGAAMIELTNHEALRVLIKDLNPKSWRGRSPLKWCTTAKIPHGAALATAGPEPMDRRQLFEFSGRPDVNAQDFFLAVCAWGGMRINNVRLAWRHVERWRPVIDKLRADCQDRREAYHIFSRLRADGGFPGVGPAYFTKLIYFGRPVVNGYIMDQWTSRSINLLYGKTIQLNGAQNSQASRRTTPMSTMIFAAKSKTLGGCCNSLPMRRSGRSLVTVAVTPEFGALTSELVNRDRNEGTYTQRACTRSRS